ncbi:helix-turn-helix domain-containing protein [Rhodococcoides trifolii]|uniref:helix-turn-helix domain-containing protein n=1 Tax=Rhodococcoides trifolii TaxID=908250 RepID=UPI001664085F|nr:helix-turn-helix domain-containing protein [Rhodococcus trifolii]
MHTFVEATTVQQLGPVSRRVVELFDTVGEWPLPDNSSVAGLLHISEPHLRRLLAGESTSMGALRAHHYSATAVRCLRRGESVSALSARLGYSESRAFRRAFRRWTGVPPSAIRQ